jgi:hypothetical protein
MHKPSANRNVEHAATDPHTALVRLVRALARSAARVQLRGEGTQSKTEDDWAPSSEKKQERDRS